MDSGTRFLTIASVVIVSVILQAVFILAEKRGTPDKAAAAFAKAYFLMDKSMGDYLCNELTGDEETDVVGDYLNRAADEARALGFNVDYMRSELIDLETDTYMVDDTTAEVHLTAKRLRSINPIYVLIGRLFFLIETQPVSETLNVIKEEGSWKVCGQPLLLIVEEG